MAFTLLIATIPERRGMCQMLLTEIETRQTRRPDRVLLCLDGFDDAAAAPKSTIETIERRSAKKRGPGTRWLHAEQLAEPDDVLVCVDDDLSLTATPGFLAALCDAVESNDSAAAAAGRDAEGKLAPFATRGRGRIVYGAGCGFSMKVKHLAGIGEFAGRIKADGGPDAIGVGGDDDALVSAHLWTRKIPIVHAPSGVISMMPSHVQSNSKHLAARGPIDAQKEAIARMTGWPWKIVRTMGASLSR